MANEDENDTTTYICRVYDSEDLFTFGVQIALGLIAITVLYWKRYFEHPRRLFTIWFLDVSKQGIGCIYAHILNMIIAAVFSRGMHDGSNGETSTDVDECAWYGISFVIDTTIGLALSILLLHQMEKAAVRFQITPLLHTGVYTGQTAMYHWTVQLLSWIAILSIAKLCIYLFMWLCAAPLATIATLLFTLPFSGRRRWELVFVMILMPAVLNCVYFWIADNNLKAGDDEVAAHEIEPDGIDYVNMNKKEQLMQNLPHNKSADGAMTSSANGTRRNWTVFGNTTTSADQPLAVPAAASV